MFVGGGDMHDPSPRDWRGSWRRRGVRVDRRSSRSAVFRHDEKAARLAKTHRCVAPAFAMMRRHRQRGSAMARKKPDDVRNITTLGAGPIGAGWAAYFLAQGYDVTAWVFDRAEEGKLRGLIDAAWESLEELGLAEGASR